MDDSGSSFMQINREDFDRIHEINPGGLISPVMCVVRLILADGSYDYKHVIHLAVNLFDPTARSMVLRKYERLEVLIAPRGAGSARLAGPWIRHRFFTSSIPNGYSHPLYVSDDASYYASLPPKNNPTHVVPMQAYPHILPNTTTPFPP